MGNLANLNWPVKMISLGDQAGTANTQFLDGIPNPPPGEWWLLSSATSPYNTPPAGFTNLLASSDTKTIYCSHALGDNNFDGSAPEPQGGNVGPKRTIEAAVALTRQGFPDHVCLRRGEMESGRPKVWDMRTSSVANNIRGGRSKIESAAFAWYGTGHRPRIIPPTLTGPEKSYIKWLGLHMYEPKGVIGDPAFTADCGNFQLLNGVNGHWIEDCQVSAVEFLIQIQGWQGLMEDHTVYRTMLTDPVYFKNSATSNSDRPSFMYTRHVKNLTLKQCVLLYPGWHPLITPGYNGLSITGAASNQYNHGVYVSEGSPHEGPMILECLIFQPSAHGWQLRPGGYARGNVIWGAAIGTSAGYYDRNDAMKGLAPDGRLHRMEGNLLLNGKYMYRMDGGCQNNMCTGALWGLDLTVNNNRAIWEVFNNIVAGTTMEGVITPPATNIRSYKADTFRQTGDVTSSVKLRGNKFWHFTSGTEGDDQNFIDPGRGMGDYFSDYIGFSVTDAEAAAIQATRPIWGWNPATSVKKYGDHIAQGYNQAA